MELDWITLHNFRGIRNLTVKANGKSLNIYGDNESGKTTFCDAVAFLFFNKDTKDRSPDNFGIKTRKVNKDGSLGEHLRELDHSVEAHFTDVESAKSGKLTLKKIYKEKWQTRRGSREKYLASHEIDYYVDGIKCKTASEYKDVINSIADEEVLKMLMIPEYFAGMMHWQDRRRILKDMAGDISDQEVVDSEPKLATYFEILGERDHDKVKRFLSDRKKAIVNGNEGEDQDTLSEIKTRLDEASLQLIDGVDEQAVKDAESKKKQLIEQLDKLDEEISKIKAGGGSAKLKVKLEDEKAALKKIKNDHTEKENEKLKEARKKVEELEGKKDTLNTEFREAKREYENAEALVTEAFGKKESIEQQISVEKSKEFQPPESEDACQLCERDYQITCPDCGHSWDSRSDQSQTVDVKKMEAKWNLDKAERLKALKIELEKVADEFNDKTAFFNDKKAVGTQINSRLNQVDQALQKANAKVEELKKSITPVEDTDEYKKVVESISDIEKKVGEIDSDREKEAESVRKEKADIQDKIKGLSQVLIDHESNKRIYDRIENLTNQRDALRDELELIERGLDILQLFEITQNKFITGKVNEMFDNVTWQMFEVQVNGEINTNICEAVYNSNLYNESLNNAGRIQAGVEIIHTLSKYYGVQMPMVIDERESVVRLPDYGMQIISMIVKEGASELEIEPVK